MNAGERPIEPLVEQFLALTLPKPEWTHRAHLRVGLWHLLRYPPGEALVLLRERIATYNVASGCPNTETGGYHESITAFYTWQIARFVEECDRTEATDVLAEQLIATYGAKDLPLAYWTESRLMSVPARLGWVAPDLRPLTPLPISGWTPG